MLDPRIYRAAFIVVVLAVMVFAFSLDNDPGALHTALAPEAFSGPAAVTTLDQLARDHPPGAPGSAQDGALAEYVSGQLRSVGKTISVNRTFDVADTVDGSRTLETITATDPGLTSGTIVIVAPRDVTAAGAPPKADLSATAVLLQLAAVVHDQSLRHTIEFVSTSGTVGGAGTTQLAQTLAGQPVDAVIVLGDLVAQNPSQPVVIPWSGNDTIAPEELRNTLASALGGTAGVRSRNPGIPAQLARLALPFTTSPQEPFAAHGQPAVYVSLAGEHGSAPGEKLDPDRMAGVGQALLQSIDAIDAHPALPPPTSFLTLSTKIVPFWAIRLLVLSLLMPVLAVTVDGVLRATRRGHSMLRWTAWVLTGVLPFVLGAVVVLLSKLVGIISVAPPGPLGAGEVPFGSTALIVLILVALVVVAGFGLARMPLNRLAAMMVVEDADPELGPADCAGPAVLLVASLAALALWLINPYAAALLVPALHLWIWIVDADLRIPRPIAFVMVLIGLVPPLLVVAYYVHMFGLSPTDLLWNGTLLIAGGGIGPVLVLVWCVVLGCLASTFVISVTRRGLRDSGSEPVTVRGPVTYAGPGSLGGTKSALRR